MSVNLGAITGGFGGIVKYSAQILGTLGVAAVVGAILYGFYRIKKFDTKVIIFSRRDGKTVKVFMDKGAFIRKKGVTRFRLLKQKVTIAPPDYKYLIAARRANYLMLYQISDDEFFPVKAGIDNNNVVFKAQDAEVRLWLQTIIKQIKERYSHQNFFDRYAGPIIFAIAAVLCIVLIYMTVKQIGDLTGPLNNIAQALKSAAPAAY